MSEKPLAYEPEVKAIQYGWEKFPADVLRAMVEKTDHPDIFRHGRVDQYYLDKSNQGIFDRVLEEFDRRKIYFGEAKDQLALANPAASRELRVLLKPDLKVAQVTVKGKPTHAGISCRQLETDPAQSEEVLAMIEENRLVRPELVTGKIEKVWHDIRVQIDGQIRVVEHDILTSHSDLMIVETEVNVAREEDAVMEIARMIAEKRLPAWFEEEVTARVDLKNFKIASAGIPDDVLAKMAAVKSEQRDLTRRIARAYGR